MLLQEVFGGVEKERDYIVDILRRLIAVDTSIPPGENYGRLIDIVEPEFKQLGFETRRVNVPAECVRQIPYPLTGERTNLVANLKNGKPGLSVYAHMDVVPVDEHWTRDPFGGQVVDGKLYGRGTVDDKGPIACTLGAMKVLHDMGIEPQYAIDCMLCTDEEVGFYPGSRYLAEKGFFSNHILWLDLGAIEPIFVIGAAGSVAIEIVATGKSCHSGMNYLGVNAVEESLPVMQELMALKRIVQSRESSVPALPIPGNPSKQMQPMFNLNIIRGGTKDNIVPGECRMTINRRYIMEERYEDVLAEIRQAVDKGRANSKLLGLELDAKHACPPVVVDADTPATSRMKAAMKAVLGYDGLICGGLSGSTDLAFVIEALKPEKAQVAGFGVSRAADMRAHAVDECVHVEDLITVAKEIAYYFAA